MPRVLVTGASGFIGLHLVEALIRTGHQVRCMVRNTSRTEALRALGVELITVPFDQPALLAAPLSDIDVVYHLAGLTRTLTNSAFFRVNRDATAAIAAACAAQPRPPRLVFLSSIAASGPVPRGQVRVEADPPAPVSHYGQSKLAGEKAAERLAPTVPLTIVRPGIVFGPRDPSFVKMLQTLRAIGIHLSPGFFPPALSYIHVEDLVALLLRAAERGARVPAEPATNVGQGRYFAVAPEHPTYAELGRIVRPMIARSFAPILPVAAPVAWCIAAASECYSRLRGLPEELNFDKLREALATSWACSGEAARRDLDFLPAKPLAERLQETVNWYAQAGWL